MEDLYRVIIYIGLFVNILGFILMYVDKQKAIKHQWRISENTLMLVAVLFGSFGIYGGMLTFRHKTKHLKFKILVPMLVILHLVIINYIFPHMI
ncbi:uncharacterized membrane protein YsdA (DUF1294 family) [Clostridium punense]|uniref:Uncharacterized membrane protein YsdA (DUF1294 family) n=1 Tax=Clostridium punense TaxID=1054297 RepID=A0ABS4K1K4_9CLOT|nr:MULTISPECIES: DUF1294 domain-containing protein [Clostridium]EQB90285.1 hypothetical protein M918_00780 [Clostridium sp. BL8]MBP2021659.1 uncharacterized membrane protein YsdA (DUF1294 family) [Clostridium punense]